MELRGILSGVLPKKEKAKQIITSNLLCFFVFFLEKCRKFHAVFRIFYFMWYIIMIKDCFCNI